MHPRYGLAGIFALPVGLFRHYVSTLKYESEYQEAVNAYSQTLDSCLEELNAKRDQFISARLFVDPPPSICEQIATERSDRLFERSIVDGDFLSFRVGLGTVPFSVQVTGPEVVGGGKPDPLLETGAELVRRFQTVDEMPICVSLRNSFGVLGAAHKLANAIRVLVSQVATFHSPDVVKIAAFLPQEFDGNYLRQLPHVKTEDGSHSLSANHPAEGKKLCDRLIQILTDREASPQDVQFCPVYIVIVGDPSLICQESNLLEVLGERGQRLGVTPIFLGASEEDLPSWTHSILDTAADVHKLRAPRRGQEVNVLPDLMSQESVDTWAQSLGCVRLERTNCPLQAPS